MISCNVADENDAELFAGISLNVLEDERIVSLSESIHTDYTHLSSHGDNIPLFRAITGQDHILYVGLPYATSLRGLAQAQSHSAYTIAIRAGGDTVLYGQNTRDDMVVSEYAARFNRQLIYLLAGTPSPILADSLFNEESLSARILPD